MNDRTEYFREYRKNNKQKIKRISKTYYKNNRGVINHRCKEWIKKNRNNPKYIYQLIKYRCNRKSHKDIKLNMSKKEFCDWYKKQKKECFYCGIPEDKIHQVYGKIYKKDRYRLEIDRVDMGIKEYNVNNILLCCPKCNSIKSNFFNKEEMLTIGNIIKEKYRMLLSEQSVTRHT